MCVFVCVCKNKHPFKGMNYTHPPTHTHIPTDTHNFYAQSFMNLSAEKGIICWRCCGKQVNILYININRASYPDTVHSARALEGEVTINITIDETAHWWIDDGQVPGNYIKYLFDHHFLNRATTQNGSWWRMPYGKKWRRHMNY